MRAAVADVQARIDRLLAARGRTPASAIHRTLGHVLWDACGLSRTAQGLARALGDIAALSESFDVELSVPGGAAELNQELERAGRVADYLELALLMCRDALARDD